MFFCEHCSPLRRCGNLCAAVLSPPLEGLSIATAETIVAPASNSIAAVNPRPARMVSLDVFRGATIVAMILVNDPGSWSHIYPPLEHAEWNGWTPTDLIFPFFLFIVGVSLTLSFASRIARGLTSRALAIHVVRRSALIFAIGLFLNGFPSFDLSSIRIMGVLQRIALCYLVAGLLYLATFQREPARRWPRSRARESSRDGGRCDRLARRILGADDVRAGAGLRRGAPRQGRQSRRVRGPHAHGRTLVVRIRNLGSRRISFHASRDCVPADRDSRRRMAAFGSQPRGAKRWASRPRG